jgi:glycosyltransferase involved in cell wall biosynthesis
VSGSGSGAWPAVAVVIPAYEAAHLVGEAIESALSQAPAPAEIVVVDDCSSDETAEVAASFGPPVTVLRHETNRGDGVARNTGVANTTSPVVVQHDADDRMLPGRLSTALECLTGPSQPAVVLSQMRSFTDDRSPLPLWALGADGSDIRYGVSQVMAWRWVYEQVGDHDEALRPGSDTDWLLRAQAAGLQIEHVAGVVLERRIHAGNVSHRTDLSMLTTRSLRKLLAARRQTGQ